MAEGVSKGGDDGVTVGGYELTVGGDELTVGGDELTHNQQ